MTPGRVLGREGMRRDELGGLCWRDLDLERGHIMLDENKTDDPRSWSLDPAVARALKMWQGGLLQGREGRRPRLRRS